MPKLTQPASAGGQRRLSRRAMVQGGLAAAAALPKGVGSAAAQKIPDFLVEPAQALIGKMASSLLGDVAGPLASGALIKLLGLGGNDADNYETYFAAIENKLDDIKAQLGEVQESLGRLTSDIAALTEKVTDVAVQNLLANFSENVNIIDVNFTSYRSALAALASSDSGQREAGAQQLFNLFDTVNAQNISVALRNVQDAFLPRYSQQTGLLAYQSEAITAAMTSYAANPSNLKIPAYRPYSRGAIEVPNDDGVLACGVILSGSHQIASDMLNSVVADTLRAFLTVQLQGMVLLSSAWLRTINAPQLQSHIDRNKRILAAMAKFPLSIVQTVDDSVAANFKRFGKPLGRPLATSEGTMWVWWGDLDTGYAGGYPPRKPGYPFSNDFIMWGRYFGLGTDLLLLVERPWDYENCRMVGVYAQLQLGMTEFHSVSDLAAAALVGLGRWPLPRFDKTIPKNLEFVAHLA